MNSNDYALRVLVQPLQTTEVNSRKQFLEALENFELEKGNIRILNRGLDNNNGPSYEIKEATSFYLVILRLSKECPFKDVRASCENILTKLKVESFISVFFRIWFYLCQCTAFTSFFRHVSVSAKMKIIQQLIVISTLVLLLL